MARIGGRSAMSVMLVVVALLASSCASEQVPSPSAADATATETEGLTTISGIVPENLLVNLSDRTGRWTATLGTAADTAPLNMMISCEGEGTLRATYAVASVETAIEVTCGRPSWQPRNEAGKPGPVTVTIEPGDGQRWSLSAFRGALPPQ